MCIKVSCKLGMFVAMTPGIDNKGPRAKRTKPKYHTLGLKRKIKKRIAASLAMHTISPLKKNTFVRGFSPALALLIH